MRRKFIKNIGTFKLAAKDCNWDDFVRFLNFNSDFTIFLEFPLKDHFKTKR